MLERLLFQCRIAGGERRDSVKRSVYRLGVSTGNGDDGTLRQDISLKKGLMFSASQTKEKNAAKENLSKEISVLHKCNERIK